MVKEGIPFIAVPVLAAGIFFWIGWWPVSIALVLVAAFMAYFFRDPRREAPSGDGLIISAADGRVTRIENLDAGRLVSVFLSPLDVHINRSPISGKISRVDYVAGKKMPATSDASSLENERNSLVIEGDRFAVTCTQIAGILARRIVCWAKAGDNLERGEKFGLIKFSSRTDLLMPPEVEILVKVGDRVRGGETIIGRVPTNIDQSAEPINHL
jgi:phosphatidylserine decarboxylase